MDAAVEDFAEASKSLAHLHVAHMIGECWHSAY